MKNYLNTLNEREQWMVITAVVCVVFYLYYMVLYSPLSTRVTQKRSQLIEKTQTLAWMKQVQPYKSKKNVRKSINDTQLLSVLSQQLSESGFARYPYQLQQTSSHDIQLTFESVPFQLLVGWLDKMNQTYTISIKELDAELTDTPGVTKLSVILSGAN